MGDARALGGGSSAVDRSVKHRHVEIDGIGIFYREAGAVDAPVVLLPHGYPSSSFQFRNLMPALADRWRLLAPDFPGCGYSATPADFPYGFDGYAGFLDASPSRSVYDASSSTCTTSARRSACVWQANGRSGSRR